MKLIESTLEWETPADASPLVRVVKRLEAVEYRGEHRNAEGVVLETGTELTRYFTEYSFFRDALGQPIWKAANFEPTK